MSRAALTGRRGSGARGGQRRNRGTRRGRAAGRRRRLAVAIAIGALVGVGLIQLDVLEDTIREVTLPLRHDDIIRQQAREKDVDADLIAGVIYTESRFRDQTSSAGARGLMQITPQTANYIERRSGGETFRIRDLADPDINVRYGTFYLRELLDRYGGNEVAALSAYNAGPTNADTWGGSAMTLADVGTAETRHYVEEVLEKREDYRQHYGEELGLGG